MRQLGLQKRYSMRILIHPAKLGKALIAIMLSSRQMAKDTAFMPIFNMYSIQNNSNDNKFSPILARQA